MKSIEARFKRMVKKYPNHSSLICFGIAICGQKLKQRSIAKHFKKLVAESDYEPEDHKGILKHLLLLTNLAEDDVF